MAKASREGAALLARIGSRVLLFPSAMGQAILISMDDDTREVVFEIAGRVSAETEAEGRSRYFEAKSIYEVKGFCTGYGIWHPDVNGIAVPVFSMSGAQVYGLYVGGPSFRVKPKQLETVYGPKLIQAAQNLSIQVQDPIVAVLSSAQRN